VREAGALQTGGRVSKSDSKRLEQLLKEVLQVERLYAYELKNVTAERRSKVLELIERFSIAEAGR